MPVNAGKFRERLEALRAETQAAIENAKSSTRPVELDQTMVGRVSRIDAIQQQEMALASERRRHAELQKIEAALARIESGDYGYCAACDEEIAEKRLELDPTAMACIKCASGKKGG
ncbi:MAG: TraR/DksA family transcriptional regulator [Alphaproteobacteria bacterium]|nr:TraR/DksA family transcriptional regulator [Alphaproteobacteria bacterium]